MKDQKLPKFDFQSQIWLLKLFFKLPKMIFGLKDIRFGEPILLNNFFDTFLKKMIF